MPNPIYLIVAYSVFWALTFVLVTLIWSRQRRLDREIETLRDRLDERRDR